MLIIISYKLEAQAHAGLFGPETVPQPLNYHELGRMISMTG
jgi:hypothetical protein